MSERTFYLLTYDIGGGTPQDDKRRLKLAKALLALGDRVQYSVFEAYLTPQELKKLLQKVEKLLDSKQDSLRVYSLCESCRAKARAMGTGKISDAPDVMFV